ncbi:MAG: hypothetical protein LIP28_09815, partial [Deltaproteobacteria bacterium]|nr:hypothetical protein [Deltaproteobacteria bacterium]
PGVRTADLVPAAGGVTPRGCKAMGDKVLAILGRDSYHYLTGGGGRWASPSPSGCLLSGWREGRRPGQKNGPPERKLFYRCGGT